MYIEKTLNSILDDSYPNKEIVIINDGSIDNTDKVIREWIINNNDKIAINYTSRGNKGVTKTLNEMVAKSRGEYITIIASDDYLLPGGIMTRYNYLKNNPKKLAVFGDCIIVDSDGNKTHDSGLSDLYGVRKDNYSTDKGLKREILSDWSVPGGTLMVKRRLYDYQIYDIRLLIEDLDFFLKMVSNNILSFMDVKVSAYRVHGKNTCMLSGYWIKVQEDIVNSYLRNLKHFNLKDRLLMVLSLLKALRPLIIFKTKKLLGLKQQ